MKQHLIKIQRANIGFSFGHQKSEGEKNSHRNQKCDVSWTNGFLFPTSSLFGSLSVKHLLPGVRLCNVLFKCVTKKKKKHKSKKV